MLILGWHFFVWGSKQTERSYHCGACGKVAPFVLKRGMRFLTAFFFVPIIPLSGVKHMIECPSCRTRFEAPADARPAGAEDVPQPV